MSVTCFLFLRPVKECRLNGSWKEKVSLTKWVYNGSFDVFIKFRSPDGSEEDQINMKQKTVFLSLIFILPIIFISSNAFGSNDPQRLFSLIDYIGGDYQFAVSKGRIINDNEYTEMLDFSESAVAISSTLEITSDDLIRKITRLSNKINARASVQEVKDITNEIKKDLISGFNITRNPSSMPSLSNGSVLFARHCTACHGERGNGRGILAENLIPEPTNFQSLDVSLTLSPLKVYNTLNFGIKDTAMPAFVTLTDKEKWDVAFYVLSAGFPDHILNDTTKVRVPEELSDYKALSSLTNQQISERLNLNRDDNSSYASIMAIRNSDPDNDPNNSNDKNKYIEFAIAELRSALKHYKNNEHEKALDSSIDAYLNGYELVEADIFLADGLLASKIEQNMARFRSEVKKGAPADEVERLTSDISKDLNKASDLLYDKNTFNSAVLFTSSFSIILREGLEAILIIAAIIAFLVNTGSRRVIRYIHVGWVSAIVAGLITWYVARTIISISGLNRELIEGITSLIAAAVLFYVSYWLISKIEVEKWKEFIKTKIETALNKKSIMALVTVSFFAVYREAFETVLFYQALGYQAENNISPVIWGFVAGVAVTGILGFLIFKLAISIPIRYFFSATSLLLYFLCFILVGKGIYELQSAGMIGTTIVDYVPRIDILGIYPTLETLIPQSIIVVAFIFASFWIANVSGEKERKEIAMNVSRISEELKTMYDSFDHIKGHILEWKKCEDIDLEAEELDHQIHDVIDHVDQLQNKLGDFYQNVSSPQKST